MWLSQERCFDIGLRFNYAYSRMVIFDTISVNNRNNKKYNKRFILKENLKYALELYERNDDYLLAPEVMTIEPECTGKTQHTLRA